LDASRGVPNPAEAVNWVGGPSTADGPFWACSPKKYRLHGVVREFYYVGALAAALGRSSATIRRWERLGVLPATPFRMIREHPGSTRRLYTESMIQAIVAIAESEGVLDAKVASFANNKFSARVWEVYFDTAFRL
jgi:hypothetical protein